MTRSAKNPVKAKTTIMLTTVFTCTSLLFVTASPAADQARASYWSEFDASQRLSIGRFAAAHGIDHAICLGYGAMKTTKYGERKFRAFDCRVGDDSYEHERQLTLRVLGPARFAVTWLKPQDCTDAP